MDQQLEGVYEAVVARNPGEAEFHQAAARSGPGWRVCLTTISAFRIEQEQADAR